MPQPVPLERGKYYHIYNRGNNRENIFLQERNYAYFLKLYARHIEPVADTFAYCLMRNHFGVGGGSVAVGGTRLAVGDCRGTAVAATTTTVTTIGVGDSDSVCRF